MELNKVTISGPDDKVSHDDLLKLQKQYPFVEWGVLISRKRMGSQRYPSADWIRGLSHDLNVSHHLCGEICREFVGGNYDVAWEYGDHWKRLQLNFSFKEDYNWGPLLLGISEWAASNPEKAVILAYNKGSKKNLDTFIWKHTTMPDNVHFLYDSSGGRGNEITQILPPLPNFTSYAGGIGPHNAGIIIPRIIDVPIDRKVGIDMETGVRTGDEFDLPKVNQVLEISEPFVNH